MTDASLDAQAAVIVRAATRSDLSAVVAILAADTAGGHGDSTAPEAEPDYAAAFARIAASPNDRLFVAEAGGRVVGTFQMTFVTSLVHRGRLRAIVEAVQVAPAERGRGIGATMMHAAIATARAAGAGVVELTSNAARLDAHRFYERLGFVKSHVGFKLALT